MPLDAEQIHIAPARIYVGTTAPATGDPPTWAPHTNGLPGTGVDVGFTLGDAVFSWKPVMTDVPAEQSLGIVDIFISEETAQLEFEAQQRTYELLKAAFNNIGTVDDVTRTG